MYYFLAALWLAGLVIAPFGMVVWADRIAEEWANA